MDGKRAPRKLTKRKLLGVLLIVGFLGALLFIPGLLHARHPQFGIIYEANAYDLDYARFSRFGKFLRRVLPRTVVQSPYFPERFKDQSRALRLGDTQLEWSIGGPATGWLYFWEGSAKSGPPADAWEFAPCAETDFLRVSQLPARFYCRTDRLEVFGAGSTSNAIPVAEGSILFARRRDQPARIYLLDLNKQQQTKLTVRYCIIEGKSER